MFKRLLLTIIAFIAGAEVVGSRLVEEADASNLAKETISGELQYITLDRPGVQWVVRDIALRTLTPLANGYSPPEKDSKGARVQPGSLIQVDCLIDPDIGECAPVNGTLTVTKVPKGPTGRPEAVSQRLLVMILDYPECGLPANMTVDEVRTVYLGPMQDGNGGLAQKLAQCSYGRFTYNVTAFRAVRVPHVCTPGISASCSFWAIATLADAATKSLIGISDFLLYSHYTYIVPPGLSDRCPWLGLATTPGRQTWLQSTRRGVYTWSTVMQETIHNYGLWHSWRNGIEYEDYSTAMGRGDACPNAAEISRMGWATPASGGGQLNSSSLPAGAPRSFILPATYLTSTGNYLRVQPNWLPSYRDPDRARNLYFAVRVAKGGDESLRADLASKVHVHEVNATMDNGYPTTYVNSDRRIQIIGTLGPRSQMTLPTYNIVVYAGSWIATTTDTLRLYLCCYSISSSECPPLEAVEQVLPPNPPLPSPPKRAKQSKPPPPASKRQPAPAPLVSDRQRPSPPPSPRPPKPPSPSPPSPVPPNPFVGGCPTVPGYTVEPDTTHHGDDIACDGRVSADTLAARCNIDKACKAFNAWITGVGHSAGCTKMTAETATPLPGFCLYTKTNTGCDLIPGYTLTPGADLYGGDIGCEAVSAQVAASSCYGSNDCRAFSIYAEDDVAWACTKHADGPINTEPANCFYTKLTASCPQVSGYTVAADQEHVGGDIECALLSLQDAVIRCSDDTGCRGFNTFYDMQSGAAYACTKRVVQFTTAKAGVCFYTKN